MKDIKFNERLLFSGHDPQDVKLFPQLRAKFSHLNEHKFRHNFKACVSPICDSELEIQSTKDIFLPCHYYHVE